MTRNEDNPEKSVLPSLISPLTEPRGQIEIYQNLIANFSKKRKSMHKRISRFKKLKENFLTAISKVYIVSHHNMKSTQSRLNHQMHFMKDISSKLMM